MLWIFAGILISYLLGAIPTAYLFGRLLKGIDIRAHGSGNVGATNALRVLGKGPGIAVLLLDVLKGAVAVAVIGPMASARMPSFPQDVLLVVCGVVAICGHNWTVFLQFKGGKGVATSLGVLIGLAFRIPGMPLVILCVVATWGVVFLASRFVSLGSIIAAAALPIYIALFVQSKVILGAGILLALFVVFRHHANISRLLQGKEPRIQGRS